MKIRQGFVSNSSTSSFVIYGVKLSEKEIQKFITSKIGKIDFNKRKKEEIEEGEGFTYELYGQEIKSEGVDIVNNICYEAMDEVDLYGIYVGKDMGGIDSITNVSPEDLIEMRSKLKELFPAKTAKFYGGIVENG